LPPISLDGGTAESRYLLEPADRWTPEKIFDRNWALTVLERVLTRLRASVQEEGKGEQFDHLKVYLTGEDVAMSYHELGATLGMTEGAVKVAVHRLRRRYRDLLYDEIAQTVPTAEEVDLELQYLVEAL